MSFHGKIPPSTILQAARVSILHLSSLKGIGRLDLSSLLSLKDLELGDIEGIFSLTPPPNLERFKIEDSNIDMVDLIQGLKETKIIKLEIWSIRDIGRLDLSSLLSIKDLELGNVYGHFSLTPPPNLESFKIEDSNIDMVDLIQGLKETKIIKLKICDVKDIGRLDLSSLLSLKDLELGDIEGIFSLTPPPNLERFKIEDSNIDMVDLIQGLKETKIIKLEIWSIRYIGRLDLSSLLSVKDLELIDVYGHFSLTPPPNLESLKIDYSNIDMVDLIQGLKETKIIKLEICYAKDIGRLDLSSLLSVKDLVLRNVYSQFSLTPPPNLEILKFNDSDIDMVGFNHSEIWEPAIFIRA